MGAPVPLPLLDPDFVQLLKREEEEHRQHHLDLNPHEALTVLLQNHRERCAEIRSRNEFKHRGAMSVFVLLCLLAGAFGRHDIPSTLYFAYPLINVCIASEWAYFNRQVNINALFIQTEIESRLAAVLPLGWESWWRETSRHHLQGCRGLTRMGAWLTERGRASLIFIGAPLLSIALGLARQPMRSISKFDWVLVAAGVTCAVIAAYVIRASHVTKHST